MDKRNTITKEAYFIKHICYTSIATVIFKNTSLFFPVWKSDFLNDLILWLLAGTLTIMGMVLTWRKRNNLSLMTNVLSPSCIWLALSQINSFSPPILCVAIFVPMLYWAMTTYLKCKSPTHKRFFLHEKAILFLRRFRRGVLVSLATILLALGIRTWFGLPVSQERDKAKDSPVLTISDCLDTLSSLEPNTWQSLNDKEKTKILQTIADIEVDAYGLPNKITVKIDSLKGQTLGMYSHYSRTIKINKSVLNDSAETVQTLLHETRHAWQHELVSLYDSCSEDQKNLYIFRVENVAELKENLDNYKDYNDDDYESYFFQTCEIDARESAQIASLVYFNAIKEYLQYQEDS